MFVKNKDDFLQMCVDYCGLNWLTIKNQYPLPLISRLLDQLSHVKVWSKIDLHGACTLVCIWEGDEWKFIFWIYSSHFEYVVMPFGFTNAHIIFQHLMNDVFHEYLDKFVVCYINDIFIFSKNKEEYEQNVRLVLDKFKGVGLYVKLEKCKFHQIEVEFFEYFIFGNGIFMDFYKVPTIGDQVTPTFMCDVQCFLGFTNFY